MNVGYYKDGGLATRPKYGTKPEEKDNWFQRYVKSKTKADEETQKTLDKSPLTSWMSADVLGLSALLRKVAGQDKPGDTLNAALFPLNFTGVGKLASSALPKATVAKSLASNSAKVAPTTPNPKGVSSIASRSLETIKKIFTLPQTRKAEAVKQQEDWARKTAEAVEFAKNNPAPPRPTGPGAPPQKPELSLWDDAIGDALPDNSFWSTPEVIEPPKSAIRTLVEKVGSTIAKPVTAPAKFLSRVTDIVGNSWKYGENKFVRWDGSFDFFGRDMLMREMASRSIGKIAQKVNPKLTLKDKVDKLNPYEPAINAFSKLQKYMYPVSGGRGIYDLKYKNIPKNILQNFVKNPISKAKLTFSELRELASASLRTSDSLLVRSVAKGKQFADAKVQGLVDSVPGGFGGILQILRGIHRTTAPYEGPPLSIYERLAMSKTGEIGTPANAYGPGNYFATSGTMSKRSFQAFGPYQYKTALTPSAILKVLRSKGFATREQVKEVAEKYDMPYASLEGIAYRADDPLMKALIDEGYLGYRHLDAFTNWMMGLMPGMGFKLVKGPKVPNVSATTLPDGSIDLSKTSIPKVVIRRSEGGLIPKYFAAGGYAMGTDTVPAMLTPGEFVMSKYAVDTYGVENMKAINSGSSVGDSVYNYNLNLNVKSDANPDDIARAVMVQIKSVDAQRIRGTRI
jgi:hypothetical protein